VKLVAAIAKLSCKNDEFSNDELGNRPRVREWGVEDTYAMTGGIFEVDLVCAYAKTPDYNQVACFGEDSGSQLRFRSNA
jgi:hypothetical protein